MTFPLPDIQIPPEFAQATIAREGAAGRAWIDSLPATVASLARRWDLDVDGPLLHGYTAIVVPVRQAGVARMLKVRWLDASTAQEGLALRIWNGQGAVQLVAEDDEAAALLLERLDPQRSLADAPEGEAVRVAARLLGRLAVPAPPEVRTVADAVKSTTEELPALWERAHPPFPRETLDHVLALASALADPAGPGSTGRPPLVVNCDLHYENVLRGTREPWLAIDPKILAGDLEYAVAQLIWNRASELATPRDLDRRLAAIAAEASLDAGRALRWTVVRLVEYWVWAAGTGKAEGPETCRRLLDWLRWESVLRGFSRRPRP